MKTFKIPFGKSFQSVDIAEHNLLGCLESRRYVPAMSEADCVRDALARPIASPRLGELAKTAKKILLITNDMTRPMPSKITIPAIIEEIKNFNSSAVITIIIASGLHRAMSKQELIDKMGIEIVDNYPILVHNAYDNKSLVSMGVLSTGNHLWLNKAVVEHDLVISEGFIEAHWLAGFSGGRKSVLPGIAGAESVMKNHSPKNVDHPMSRAGVIDGNPAHREFAEAAIAANLKFILNVVLDDKKKIIKAFAGDTFAAHHNGCEFVRSMMEVPCRLADIAITSNSGYPLDLNLYQSIKGMNTAASSIKAGGVIIIATECSEGIGHGGFLHVYDKAKTPEALLAGLRDGSICEYDQWAAQVMLNLTQRYTVIVVTNHVAKDKLEAMFVKHADNLQQALEMAFAIKGDAALVNVIPEGPLIIPVQHQNGASTI
jgi:nickel-dependent lactate racemase